MDSSIKILTSIPTTPPLLSHPHQLQKTSTCSIFTNISSITKKSEVKNTSSCIDKICDDDHIEQYRDAAGEKKTQCLWCNNKFSNWHATMMEWNLIRIKGKGLAVCNSSILLDCLACYHMYYGDTTEKREGRERGQRSW